MSPNFFPPVKEKNLHGAQMSARQHQCVESTCSVTGDTGKQFHSRSDFRAPPMAVSPEKFNNMFGNRASPMAVSGSVSGLKSLISLAVELCL